MMSPDISIRELCDQLAERDRELALLRAQLAASDQATLKTVLDNCPVAIVVADVESRLVLANPLAERLCVRPIPLGRDFDTHSTLQLFLPDGTPWAPRDLPLTRSALDGETFTGVDMVIRWPDGQERYLLVNTAPVIDQQGRRVGAVGAFQDNTERKRVEQTLRESEARNQQLVNRLQDQAEELELQAQELRRQNDQLRETMNALAEQEARYRALDELVPFGIWVCAPDGRPTYLNPSFLKLIGMTLEECRQFGWASRLPAGTAEHTLQDWAERQTSGETWNHEHRIRAADGIYRVILSRGVPMRDRAGTITAWIGIHLDITERHELEVALREARDELELKVTERTAMLEAANEALVANRAQLRSLSRRLVETGEDLQRSIARELHDGAGGTLTALKIGLGQLRREAGDLPPLAGQIERLRDLTDNLTEELHLLSSNLRPISLDRYGLVAALRQHVESYRQQTGLHVDLVVAGIGAERLAPDAETTAYRVVQEALTNVARHAKAQRVGVILERRTGNLLAIIEDDGQGFDVDGAWRRGRLGLLGMRERAEMLGGTINVESRLGAGTTVFLELPVDPKASAES